MRHYRVYITICKLGLSRDKREEVFHVSADDEQKAYTKALQELRLEKGEYIDSYVVRRA